MSANIAIKHEFFQNKQSINDNNIEDGTIWYCKEDNSHGVKFNNILETFGNLITLYDATKSNSQSSLLYGIYIINNKSDINVNDYDENINVLFLSKNDKKIILLMNRQIVFEITGS